MTRRRVVVTGLGIVCPIGNSVQEAWAACVAGKPGITRITRFDPSRLHLFDAETEQRLPD